LTFDEVIFDVLTLSQTDRDEQVDKESSCSFHSKDKKKYF
jgi:hypothetical protein